MEEVWKTIVEYPNYMISNLGGVYSCRRDRMLKTSVNGKGYLQVNLENNGYWVTISVHRLVAFEFVDGFFNGAVVNHKDGVKTNCVSWNLEWITQRDNVQHGATTGLRSKRPVRVLETNDVFDSVYVCADYLGVKPAAIYKCLSDRLRTCQGYHFRYADERRIERD